MNGLNVNNKKNFLSLNYYRLIFVCNTFHPMFENNEFCSMINWNMYLPIKQRKNRFCSAKRGLPMSVSK